MTMDNYRIDGALHELVLQYRIMVERDVARMRSQAYVLATKIAALRIVVESKQKRMEIDIDQMEAETRAVIDEYEMSPQYMEGLRAMFDKVKSQALENGLSTVAYI